MNNVKQPLSEYPRPQLVRDSYLCLNGYWEYAITKSDAIPNTIEGKILVPYSPESPLSEVNRIVHPDEWLFYRLEFDLDKSFIKDKLILHFGAVDQISDVYLNYEHIAHHEGGYLPFECFIEKQIKEHNILIVKVKDYSDTSFYSRGKQKIKGGGIWYTPQSGIYMPVWLESVSNDYVKSLKITPDIDNSFVEITVNSDSPKATIDLLDKKYEVDTNKVVSIKIDNPKLWSPENPYLYQFKVKTKGDEVTSYFAMRKVSLIEHNGHKVLALNNKPYFMNGVLDQGYYQDGLYTPSSFDEYIKDINLVKSLGFNTIRKHIKIESLRWYYECDKAGILVWQDFINGGGRYKASTVMFPLITDIHLNDHKYKTFGREDAKGREFAKQEFKDTIEYLYNVPSIVLWTIFNEGWGQFDSKAIYNEFKTLDTTRLFDHASGWHDQGISDVKSMHVYFKKVKIPNQKKVKDRAIILSEYGGYVLPIEGHMQKGKRTYRSYKNSDDWTKAYETLMNRDVINNIPKGLAAAIYTQLSDVEDELNGFVTYDRKVIKVDIPRIKQINEKVKFCK